MDTRHVRDTGHLERSLLWPSRDYEGRPPMRQLTILGLATTAALAACTQTEIGDRPEPPALQVLSPERGTMQEGLATVEVRGTVTPSVDTGAEITRVEVNGMAARLDTLGNWTA